MAKLAGCSVTPAL